MQLPVEGGQGASQTDPQETSPAETRKEKMRRNEWRNECYLKFV